MATDFSKLPPPPKGVTGLTLDQLPKPPQGQQGLTLDEIQSKNGNSSVSDYANQSANPAVTSDNPTPSWFSKIIAGTPFAPASENDTSGSANYNPFVQTGKMLANVFSDAPSILAAIPQAILHPINTITGLVSAIGNVSKEAGTAIGTGIATGDWSQLDTDLKDTEVSIINHPLQTVLLMDEGLKSSKSVIEGVSDKGVSGSLSEMASDTATKAKQYLSDINKARQNIAQAFTTRSTITNHLSNIQQILSDKVTAMKNVNNLKEKLNSFTDKNKSEGAINETERQRNLADQQKAQNDLHVAQSELDALEKQHEEATKKMASDQQKEMGIKGFPSLSDAGSAIKTLARTAKDRFSNVYDQTLGKAKVNLDPVFSGFNKLKDYLTSISDTKTIKALQPILDNLRLRDIVAKYGDNTQQLYMELSKSDIDGKLYQTMSPEELKKNFPPVDSSNVKGTVSNAENVIRESNTDALKKFNEFIKSGTQDNPAGFKKAFQDAVREEYGQDRLDKISENDKNWSELLKSDLLQKDNPTLSDINKGWKDFTNLASKIPEGKSLIEKLQNYAGSEILNNAEIGGEYSANKIQAGIKKYGAMLGDTVSQRLTQVAESLRDKSDIENQQQKISDIKTQQKNLSTEQKTLEQQKAKILSDSKVVGKDSADVEKNIMKIDSMEKLQDFLDKSGKTIKELTPVIVHALIEQADKEAGKPTDANYDLNRINSFIKKMDSLGGSTSGGQEVNNALLGQEGDIQSPTQKAFNELKDANDEYQKAKSVKQKSVASRVAKAAFGAFLALGGLGFGRFKGISDVRSAFSSGAKEEAPGGRERASPPVPKKGITRQGVKNIFTAGSVAKTGQDNE